MTVQVRVEYLHIAARVRDAVAQKENARHAAQGRQPNLTAGLFIRRRGSKSGEGTDDKRCEDD